jgi:hypothetical protein
MAVRLSALHAGRPRLYLSGRFLVLISVRGCVDSRATVRLEGLGQLEKSSDLIRNLRFLPLMKSVIWDIKQCNPLEVN